MSSSSRNEGLFELSGLRCSRCGASMRLHTSHSDRNPNRLYWKCHNAKDGFVCGYFVWDDEVERNMEGCEVNMKILEKLSEIVELLRSLSRYLKCTLLVVIALVIYKSD